MKVHSVMLMMALAFFLSVLVLAQTNANAFLSMKLNQNTMSVTGGVASSATHSMMASAQNQDEITNNHSPAPPPAPDPGPPQHSRPIAPPPSIPSVRIPGHIPRQIIAASRMIGVVNPNTTIHIAFALLIRNQAALSSFLKELYDPKSPEYGKYLTPNEFAQMFCPTPQQYAAMERYALANGLKIEHTHRNRLILDVVGTAATIESTFDLRLRNYRLSDGRECYAPDNNPLVPDDIAGVLVGVVGLDNMVRLHPQFVIRSSLSRMAPQQIGTGPQGGMSPSDIKTAYDLNNPQLNGSGETLGLFEMDGYDSSDITQYENYFGLNAPILQNISVDGASGIQSALGQGEVTLDIEMMIALAQDCEEIVVYQGPNSNTGQLDTYAKIANDDIVNEISSSWTVNETDISSDPNFFNEENQIFQQMAAQGQAMLAAAGDTGAFAHDNNGKPLSIISVQDPASQPYVTGVGGTTLTVDHPGGTWQSESTWNDLSIEGYAGGGGISTIWPAPSYQQPVLTTGWAATSLGSTTMRNVPDVSLNADPNTGYAIYVTGSWMIAGGTSAAAPLWAAFSALLNQQRVSSNESRIGFMNPYLYQIGQSSSYRAVFHDINDGSNNGYYPAVKGYDDATGWGSFSSENFSWQSPLTLTIYPTEVIGGLNTALTVSVNIPVQNAHGLDVSLSSDSPSLVSMYTGAIITTGLTSSPPVIITTSPVTTQTKVTITANYVTNSGAKEVATGTLLLDPLPAISAININPSEVLGGSSATATVTLLSPAPPGGVTVNLTSDTPTAANPPSHVTIQGGATSSSPVIIATSNVAMQTTVSISASNGANSVSGKLIVDPTPALSGISVSPTAVTGGTASAATITLKSAAPPGGVTVSLSSDTPSVASLPSSVTIPAGATSSAPIAISTTTVTAPATVNITASYSPPNGNANTVSATLSVDPQPAVSTLEITPINAIGGSPVTVTVTLKYPAPAGGVTVALSSDTPSVASLPASVTIPAGATSSAPVPITTSQVTAQATATITAIYIDVNKVRSSASGKLNLYPIPTVTSININPNEVVGGSATTATVSIRNPAPPGGVTVSLSSDTPSVVTPPSSVTIPAGATSSSPIALTTASDKTTTKVNITASYNSAGVSSSNASSSLTVLPPLSGLKIVPGMIFSFSGATGEVDLPGPAPTGGATVLLTSSDPSLLSTPSSVTIPAGSSSATFTLVAGGTLTTTNVTVTATYGMAANKVSTTVPVLSILYGFLPLFY